LASATALSGFLLPLAMSNPFEARRRAKPDPILPDPIIATVMSCSHEVFYFASATLDRAGATLIQIDLEANSDYAVVMSAVGSEAAFKRDPVR
jgi:hypothetical protein